MNLIAKVEGGEELRRALLKVADQAMETLQPVLTSLGQSVTDAGAAAAPVKTGDLKGSELVKTKVRKGKQSFTFLGILQSAHAAAVHEGVFAGGKVHKQLASFKWWEHLFDKRLGAMEGEVISALQKVLDR